jgi:hypothetical protein
MLVQHVTELLPHLLAPGPVDNPAPKSPVSSTGVDMILGYAKWGALIACAVVAVVSGGLLAVGQLSNNPGHGDRGKRSLLWALGGAIVVAIIIPTLNTVFGNVV